jgi:hypothetical protein
VRRVGRPQLTYSQRQFIANMHRMDTEEEVAKQRVSSPSTIIPFTTSVAPHDGERFAHACEAAAVRVARGLGERERERERTWLAHTEALPSNHPRCSQVKPSQSNTIARYANAEQCYGWLGVFLVRG